MSLGPGSPDTVTGQSDTDSPKHASSLLKDNDRMSVFTSLR